MFYKSEVFHPAGCCVCWEKLLPHDARAYAQIVTEPRCRNQVLWLGAANGAPSSSCCRSINVNLPETDSSLQRAHERGWHLRNKSINCKVKRRSGSSHTASDKWVDPRTSSDKTRR